MKFKKLLLIFVCTIALKTQAQSYSFSVATAGYTNLTGSTSLNGTATWDDPAFIIPVGFDFEYFGVTLSTFYLSEIGLGGLLANVPNDFGVGSILQPYGADIIDRGYDSETGGTPTGSLSPISYKLEGTAGNRILKVEWNNVGFYSDVEVNGAANSNFTNFQLWLFEADDSIEIHFGPNNITDLDLAFDDLGGSSVVLVESINFDTGALGDSGAITLIGSPTNPSVSVVTDIDDIEFAVLDDVIPNGTVYRFEPSNLSAAGFERMAFKLFPNPSSDVISITGLTQTEAFSIYDVMGREVMQGNLQPKSRLTIETLSKGLYLMEFSNGNTLRFLKQ